MSQRQIQLNPLNNLATWKDIRDKRDELEISPITVDDGRIFDFNEKTIIRFQRSIQHFDSLPTLVDGKLPWKLEDNVTFSLMTKQELTDIFAELEAKQAVRGAQLHAAAQAIVDAGTHTVKDLQNPSLWGL